MPSKNADKVLAAYDKQNISPGTITPALAEYGITLLGNYRGLPLYASESQYTDVDGSAKYSFLLTKCWWPQVDCRVGSPMPESFKWTTLNRQCNPMRQRACR